ncbi:MAG: DUF432 domain-containing protein [Spirochaetales bacterium]|nr:DUF432 domain-containing protein [Spirochaetales bacterium]
MFWKSHHISDDKLYYARIGALEIWIKRYLDDWYIAYERGEHKNDVVELTTLSEEKIGLDWTRWVINARNDMITFKPVMPDKPVIVRPEISINLVPGNEGKFYINLPLWVRFEVGEREPIVLTEIPIRIHSKTWYGDTSSGELCYSLRSMVRKKHDDLEPSPTSAVCSVTLQNKSKSELKFERICLNVQHLAIYANEKALCTTHLYISFKGEDNVGQVSFARSHSDFIKNCRLLTLPRKALDRNILTQSYQFFKHIAGF